MVTMVVILIILMIYDEYHCKLSLVGWLMQFQDGVPTSMNSGPAANTALQFSKKT